MSFSQSQTESYWICGMHRGGSSFRNSLLRCYFKLGHQSCTVCSSLLFMYTLLTRRDILPDWSLETTKGDVSQNKVNNDNCILGINRRNTYLCVLDQECLVGFSMCDCPDLFIRVVCFVIYPLCSHCYYKVF